MNAHKYSHAEIARELASRLALVPPIVELAPLFEDAAIAGSCGPCGGFCQDCLPDPIITRDGRMVMPASWSPTQQQMADPRWIAAALLKGCIQDIYSEITTLPAGVSGTAVTVQPSQRACFVGLRERIVTRLATDLTLTVATFESAFVGDCKQDYQSTPAFTDFKFSDDCNWCPIPEVDIGRTNDNMAYRRLMNNLLPGTDVLAQIAIRGIPYPDRGCWRGWRVRDVESSCGCGS